MEIWEKAISLASSEDFKLLHGEMLRLLKACEGEMDISGLLDYIHKMKEENLDIYEVSGFHAALVSRMCCFTR